MQVYDMTARWKISKGDATVWLVTCFSVIIIDIDYGLLIGVFAAIILLLVRNQKPTTCKLGRAPGTDVFLNIDSYKQVRTNYFL